ncbi:DUF1440 domain-containing protein [Bdellovibrio sp. 22V]|uniref:DUF1440 domain-containing protein n=1 Tax=Bdellovibrio sp. 22V TaxID=3044166 RepID=UPI0025438EDC|nr:DUF1440 domain-containing protein [Bdellovibrio sp. 22V]WII70842.1 DUF1440 domain-containing protein [Bdellovibrio sp. 22V]
MNFLFRGIWASVLATSSMTLALFNRFTKLPASQQKPLPPAQLTQNIAKKTGLAEKMGPQMQEQATMFSHYGYGLACGVLYSYLATKVPGPAMVKGGLFGLGVWATSYYGLIPGMNLKPSAKDMARERNIMMAASHVVWGAALGYSEEALRRKGKEMLAAGQRRSSLKDLV